MSKKMGKFAALVVFAAVVTGSQLGWAADGKDVKDYIALALEKSPTITLAQLALEKNELNQADLRLQDSILSVKQVEISTKRAQKSFENTKRDLSLSVETSYIGILKAQKGLEIAQQSESQAKANLQMVKARFDAKVASKLDLINAENQARSAEISLRRSENGLKQAKDSFQKLVGSNDDIVLVNVSLDAPKVDFTEEDAVKMAVASSTDIENAADDLEIAKIQKSLTDNDFTAPNDKRKAEIAVIEANMNLDQKRTDVAAKASQLYSAVKDAADQLEIANKNVEYAQEYVRVTNLRYQAGLETASSLINSQISLTQSNVSVLDAASSYKVAVTQLLNYVGK